MVVITFLQSNNPLGLFEFDMRQCKKTEIRFEQKIKMPRLFDEAESKDDKQKSLFSHQQNIRTILMKIIG